MNWHGFVVNGLKFPSNQKRGYFLALVLLLTSTFAVLADPAVPGSSDEVKQLVKQAIKLTRDGSLADSEVLLRRAVALDSTRSEAKVELAVVLTKTRRIVEAYDLAFPIAQAEPKNSRAFAVLGTTLLAAGRFREARLVFYNAIKIRRQEDLAWASLGMLDFYENNINESLANLQEAVYQDPNEPDYLFAFAQVCARAEHYKDAADAYRQFLTVSSINDKDRRDRIRGLINFLEILGNSGSLYLAAGKPQTTVPFSLVGNRPVITLYLNGKPEPLKFVLDTGSGISVISETTAKRLNIKPMTRGGYAKGIGGNGKFEIVYGMVKQVAIGDVSLKNVPVYLRKFHDESQALDGYIGLALISKFLTTIDYGAQTFALSKRDDDKRDFIEKGDLSLPLRLTSSGFLSGEVQLMGMDIPLNFIVDTGASVSVISSRVAKADGISQHVSEEKLRVVGSAGVTDDVSTFQLPGITFGNHSRKDILAIALDLDMINEASGFEQSGILGGNFLKNYRMTFDFKNSKVTFVSVKPDKDQPQ
ncbi:hypothetical protein BH10ACI2_BH10ACI2_08320 [soil metagenome]